MVFPSPTEAVTIANQTQFFGDQIITPRVLQELGNNLSGTAASFTFRVSTSRTNQNQFNFTIQNTRIYDKDNGNSSIIGCTPPGYNASDPLGALTFNSSGVPAGFEDVTIDFSCRNYNFITGHRYLIIIANANYSSGSGQLLLAGAAYGPGKTSGSTDQFTGGGLRYSSGNLFDYSHNSGNCSGISYVWNDSTLTPGSGCFIWTTKQDDLYFILTNTSPPPPPPRLPVVFIPGIGGSELKASQDIVLNTSDGHGGNYSHAYGNNEKVWVNQDEAVKLGDDDYFDILRLKSDGVTSESSLSLTGNLTSSGYGDIDSFFTSMGYVKGTNFFVFPYDWRMDIKNTKDGLDALIEQAKTQSGQAKVNIVAHSMGGLIARYYISDSSKAIKVNKLIELGVPHLGAPSAIKTLVYGEPVGRWYFKFINIGINGNEVKDVIQNLPSHHALIPSGKYYDFYNNSADTPYPFRDDRDIDNNKVTGTLNYNQTKSLLSNLNYNMTAFGLGEQLHNYLDSILNQTNGTKIYEIVGNAQPTLGQINETWWINWPVNLIPKRDEIFINGDDTVPLYSASLKNDSRDLSGATKIYYVEQKHSDLVSSNGTAMLTVKSLLNDDNSLPVEVKDQKIVLEGQHISVDQDAVLDVYDDFGKHTGLNSNGEVETNIPNTFYDSLDSVKHIFVKKSAGKVTAKIKSSKVVKTNVKIRNYSQDIINKTTFYNNLPVDSNATISFTVDPSSTNAPSLSSGTQTILATSEATGSAALDQTPPATSIQISGSKDSSGIYSGPVTITLNSSDSSSGILRTEYSLDNGQTIQTYTAPFTISTSGKTTIQFKSIDKLGNEEIPQSITIEIVVLASPTATPTSDSFGSGTTSSSSDSSGNTSDNATSTNLSAASTTVPASQVRSNSFEAGTQTSLNAPSILGINFENPSHISDQINVDGILKPEKSKDNTNFIENIPPSQILSGLLIVSGGIAAIASVGLIATFLTGSSSLLEGGLSFVKPFPK